MPFPDWGKGKARFSQTLYLTYSGNILGSELKTIFEYSGAGEIIFSSTAMNNLDYSASETDRFYIYLDGYIVQEMTWNYMLRKPLSNDGSIIVPVSYDRNGGASAFFKRGIPFQSGFRVDYRNTTLNVYPYSFQATLGLF